MTKELDNLHRDIQNIWIEKNYEARDVILKERYEQYFTSSAIANYMASFFKSSKKSNIKILDPGAGAGSLTISFIISTFEWKVKPKKIHAVLYEIDTTLKYQLEAVLEELNRVCCEKKINFSWEIRYCNFIEEEAKRIKNGESEIFDYVILNPPYKKLAANSMENRCLLEIGIHSSNYYSAFISLAKRLLVKKGEIVAITPRSFCNGVYFNQFREDIKSGLRFINIHLFDSRTSAFSKDEVLQETIIYHCVKEEWDDNKSVKIIHSTDDTFSDLIYQNIKLNKVIYPTDKSNTIRIVKSDDDKIISDKIESLPCYLADLNIEVSTGPIVDFREKKGILYKEVIEGAVPFLCSHHIKDGEVKWPLAGAKFNSILQTEENIQRLRQTGNYVLVKRVTSKEEKKRVVCGVVNANNYSGDFLAFDNKTNYFHSNKNGIELEIARGICIYLSSSIIDMYFRIFSGHTQVNAKDLRRIKFPNELKLKQLGRTGSEVLFNQQNIDELVEKIIF